MQFVVLCGLTRRLVEANSYEDARLEFLTDLPMRQHFGGLDEWLEVRLATDDDIAEFEKRRRPPNIEGQLMMELGG